MYEARGLDGAFYIAQETYDNRYNASPATIKAKAEEAMNGHNARIDACVKDLADTLAKYSQPNEQMNAALAFIGLDLERLGSAQAIVNALSNKYPYQNWVAVKYDSILGNQDFAIAGGNMRLVRPEGNRPWNLVQGFYKQDAKFANDQYFVSQTCLDAFGGLERGAITSDNPSDKRLNDWPSGDISHGWTSFNKWCANPSVNGFWISRGNTNAEFAISDPQAEVGYHSTYLPPSPNANASDRNRIPALQFMASAGSRGGSYLILPKPLEGDERSILAQQAESARKALAARGERGIRFFNQAGYVASMSVGYFVFRNVGGVTQVMPEFKGTDNITAGFERMIVIPNDIVPGLPITVTITGVATVSNPAFSTILPSDFNGEKCFKSYGSIFNPQGGVC
jgi:hypothetical protein